MVFEYGVLLKWIFRWWQSSGFGWDEQWSSDNLHQCQLYKGISITMLLMKTCSSTLSKLLGFHWHLTRGGYVVEHCSSQVLNDLMEMNWFSEMVTVGCPLARLERLKPYKVNHCYIILEDIRQRHRPNAILCKNNNLCLIFILTL